MANKINDGINPYNFVVRDNARLVNIPNVGEVITFWDEPNKRVVISDEGYWNPHSPVGEKLDIAIAWAHSQGYKAGVVVTPYASNRFGDGVTTTAGGYTRSMKGATDDELRDYVDAADFVVVDPYAVSAITATPDVLQNFANFTKNVGEYAKSKGKDAWLVLQGFATPDVDVSTIEEYNKKLISENAGIYDDLSFFNTTDFGNPSNPNESAEGLKQVNTGLLNSYASESAKPFDMASEGNIKIPTNWNNYSTKDKIDWFNSNKVTSAQLTNIGVQKEEIDWMRNNGYYDNPKEVQGLLTTSTNNSSANVLPTARNTLITAAANEGDQFEDSGFFNQAKNVSESTAIPTATSTAIPTATSTATPIATSTAIPTEKPTATPTATSTASKSPSTSVVDNLTKQILGQGNTTNWQGGVDAQTAAKDMAKIMAGIGITDINQFGKVIQTGLQEDVRPDGRGGFVNLKGQQVDPAGVTPLEMDGNIVGYSSPTGTQETFGNKETGQIVPNTYAERQTGNAFGGTYEGKGNTAYRVDIGADGKPVFYTTGASSRDDISAFAPIIAAALTPVLGPAAASLLGPTASTLATGALTGAMVGGGTAAITGDSVLKGALLGGAGGALGDYLKAAGGATLGDASDIAMQMADSGATLPEIEAALTNSGFSPSVVAESLKDAANVLTSTTSTITTAPSSIPSLLDTVSVVAPSTAPTLTSLLTAASTIPSITANQVTSPVTTQVTTPTAEQTITSDRPSTVADIINSITSVVPTITPAAAQTIAEQVITSNRPVTTQDVINAITSSVTTPVTTPTIPEQVITGQAPTTTNQDVINSIVASIPTTTPSQVTAPTTTPAVTEQVITANRPATVADIINSITSVAPVTTTPVTTAPVVQDQVITADRPATVADIINSITSVLPVTTPTTPVTTAPVTQDQVITANRPTTISDVINSIVASVTPTVVPPATTPKTETKTEKDKSLGVSDVIRLAQIGTTVAALNAASNAGGGTNQYDIVPVPESWTTPAITGTTPSTLPAIDFGNRNLLMGTQWEKLLNPNYGKIPTPVQYSQPSNLSYNDLMGILGSKSGMPSASSLSINDIISGIQNQYGQTPRSTMG